MSVNLDDSRHILSEIENIHIQSGVCVTYVSECLLNTNGRKRLRNEHSSYIRVCECECACECECMYIWVIDCQYVCVCVCKLYISANLPKTKYPIQLTGRGHDLNRHPCIERIREVCLRPTRALSPAVVCLSVEERSGMRRDESAKRGSRADEQDYTTSNSLNSLALTHSQLLSLSLTQTNSLSLLPRHGTQSRMCVGPLFRSNFRHSQSHFLLRRNIPNIEKGGGAEVRN